MLNVDIYEREIMFYVIIEIQHRAFSFEFGFMFELCVYALDMVEALPSNR